MMKKERKNMVGIMKKEKKMVMEEGEKIVEDKKKEVKMKMIG